MSDRWMWLIRYGVVLVLAVILGATLGEMGLFKTTKLAKGLNAGHVVQFLGYGGALFVFWLLACRIESLLDGKDPRWNPIKSILVPLATLIVVACGQAVLLLVLGPLMNKSWQHSYNLIAIIVIILSVVWLLAALLTGSSSLAPLFGGSVKRLRPRGS
jgi:hypothetical protein